MFRRRPKAASEPEANTSSQAEGRGRKHGKAVPPGPLSERTPRTDAGDEAADDESSEPWYRQSGPLFDESFHDGPAAAPPLGDEPARTVFAPPLPPDPAASGVPPSVPMIQRVGQVTDPGPLGEEMRSAFAPESAAAGDEESAAGDESAGDDAAAGTPAGPAADGAAQPQEEPSPWAPSAAATARSEPGIGLGEAALAEDDSRQSDTPDPLIDFDADNDAVPEDEAGDPDASGTAGDDIAEAHDTAGDGETGDTEEQDGGDAEAHDAGAGGGETGEDALEPLPDGAEPGEAADDATPDDVATERDAAPERDDGSALDESTPDASAVPADAEPGEVAQQEPPMVVPVRGYYIARTEDTLRSVAAQFLNAPERWSELRTLNAAYPGIAELDPDELVPEGAALALPGDPLPWGRPDPVYLWTLAETFLYTAWGREPAPEEVVPFWRGLTRGALPEGEQPPHGAELPGIAEIAARSRLPGDETPAEADVPLAPPAAFAMPAVVETEPDAGAIRSVELIEEDVADDEAADGEGLVVEPTVEAKAEPDLEPRAEAVDTSVDIADAPADDLEAVVADAADAPPPVADTAELAGLVQAVEEAIDEGAQAAAVEDGADDAASTLDVTDAERAEAAADVWPPEELVEFEPDAPPAGVIEYEPDLPPAGVIEIEPDMPPPVDIVDAETAEAAVEPEPADAGPAVDESLLAEPPDAAPRAAEAPAEEPPLAEPPAAQEPPAVEPQVAEPPAVPPPPVSPPPVYPPVYGDPAAAEPILEPPPAFEEWLADPSAAPPHPDPSAPYAGMPGAGTAEAPLRQPEPEAPRVPHFMPSVTGTTAGGLTTAAQTSLVGRSLAGTAVGDAMLLWQLARRRRQSQRTAGMPDAIEHSLLQSAGSEALELIEAAMRHLYAVTVGQQRPKPNVLAVRSGTYGFEVLLDHPVPTPPGWRSASGGYVLELPQGVTARDLGAIGQGPSLCPALVPVGNTFEGPLLLNLEQLGCLAVSGPSTPAASLLAAIVGTLGSSPMAGHLRITAVGFESAAGMIGWEAVSFASYDSPELETLLANSYGPGDSTIELLVIGPENDLLIQRAGQVATAPESRLSLVGATSAVSARWPWRIHVDGTGSAVVHPISITMTAARAVTPEAFAPLGGVPPGGIDPAGLR